MCLYPKLIINPKYKKNKKNQGTIPYLKDERMLYIPIGCNKCKECFKKKANVWRIRLQEEIKKKENGRGYFVTMTFSTESLKELDKEIPEGVEGYERDNRIAAKAIRLFTERWRKKYKKSIRHWLITELGGGRYEHIHVHGLIWTKENFEEVRKIWKYGFVFPRDYQVQKNYVNSKSISYMIKYVTKFDNKHKNYKPIICTSNGIGNNYKVSPSEKNEDKYRTEKGYKLTMPIYYRNKIYTEDEREELWIKKLDENIRYIGSNKVKGEDVETILQLLRQERAINKADGYGGEEENYNEKDYENQLRDIIRKKRFTEMENNI